MYISKFGVATKAEIQRSIPSAPDALVAFLEKYNGGETPKTRFSIGGISSDIVAFYGVGNVKYSCRDFKPIDDEFWPIAFDSFGNQVVISLKNGGIGFMDHETGTRPRMIASDFKTFIDRVQSDEIDPKHMKSLEERERDLIQRGKGANISDELRALWQKEIDKYSKLKREREEVKI